jgi:hypothetical protein
MDDSSRFGSIGLTTFYLDHTNQPNPFFEALFFREEDEVPTRMIWSEPDGLYILETPFKQSFVDELKALVPGAYRKWDQPNKVWLVEAAFLDEVVTLAKAHFRECQVEKRNSQHQTTSSPLGASTSTFRDFIELVGKEAASLAWKKGLTLHHPDVGGSADKATRLNQVWEAIKKEMEWR